MRAQGKLGAYTFPKGAPHPAARQLREGRETEEIGEEKMTAEASGTRPIPSSRSRPFCSADSRHLLLLHGLPIFAPSAGASDIQPRVLTRGSMPPMVGPMPRRGLPASASTWALRLLPLHTSLPEARPITLSHRLKGTSFPLLCMSFLEVWIILPICLCFGSWTWMIYSCDVGCCLCLDNWIGV